jgi:hypothetical protein
MYNIIIVPFTLCLSIQYNSDYEGAVHDIWERVDNRHDVVYRGWWNGRRNRKEEKEVNAKLGAECCVAPVG